MSVAAKGPAETHDIRRLWPNQEKAAEIVGLDASTLARREIDEAVYIGPRKHYPPHIVLQLARQQRRSVEAAAADLLEHARDESQSSDEYRKVRDQVNEALHALRTKPRERLTRAEFVRELKRDLPARLFSQVSLYLSTPTDEAVPDIHGEL